MKQRRTNLPLKIAALAVTALLVLTALPGASTATPRLGQQPLESLTVLNSTEATERSASPSAFNAPSAVSATTAADAQNVELVGQIGGVSYAVAVQGNHAYLGVGSRLEVWDISNPANPTEVGQTEVLPGVVRDVVVAGDYAYIAAGDGGLRVINISDPAAPNKAGFYDTPGSALGVAVAGNYTYIADYWGLRVINISDPAAPSEAGFYYTSGFARGVAVAGNYAYVADDREGLRIINVSDPALPNYAGSYDTPGYAYGVAVMGSYAYVADGDSGLRIINISDPATPSETGSYDTPGWAYGVAVAGNYAYVADGREGLRVINIYDLAAPSEAGFYDTPGYAYGVAVAGNYAYVADGEGGLFTLRFTGGGATYYVPDDYSTIQAAVDAASPGDTIIVRDGIYTENVDVNKDHLIIESENGAEVTIVQAADPYDHVFEVTTDYVEISGFAVKGEYLTGIFANGIYLYKVEYCNISNNYVSNSVCGTYLKSSSNNVVTNNTVSNNASGGICLTDSSSNNMLTNNTISNISNPGIWLFCSSNNVITNNNVSNSFCGINLVDSSGNKAYLNNFIDNNHNFYSDKSTNTWNSPEEIIYTYNGNTYTNYLGNYWDDYTGSDAEGNGIGDAPYAIDSDRDDYPLMEPFENYQVSNIIYVPDDYSTIQAAIDAASPGDTIIVRDGTYTENVNVNKSITLRGNGMPVVNAGGNGSAITITADGCTIEGFTVTNSGEYAGGLKLESDNNTIKGNTCLNNSAGIYLSFSSYNTIEENNCSNNGSGIHLPGQGNNNIIRSNICSDNDSYGIYLVSSTSSSIEGNTCSHNRLYGISLYDSNDNTIKDNNCLNNYYGIRLTLSCNNTVYFNNFIDNSNNVYSSNSTNIWNSPEELTYAYNDNIYANYLGNYWSDYSGSDAEGDGIGDVPYAVGSDTDDYPLMESFENYQVSSTIYVPDDYSTIQAAVDAASPADTIIVRDGTYTENVDVNKDHLTIESENGAEVTIVQAANPDDHVFEVSAHYVNISRFTVRGAIDGWGTGIELENSSNCRVEANEISDNQVGISVYRSSNNEVLDNSVSSNQYYGIVLDASPSNTLTNNILSHNKYNLIVTGSELSEYLQSVDTSNRVDGKPVWYITNEANLVIDSTWDVGYLGIVNCTSVVVKDLTLSTNGQGVLFAYVTNSRIENVTLTSNHCGIQLVGSSINEIIGNEASRNDYAIGLHNSHDNIVRGNSIPTTERYGTGIYINGSSNNIISDNTVSNGNHNGDHGIYLMRSSNNTISKNDFKLYRWGWSDIYVDTSDNNMIYLNNFTGRGINISHGSTNIWNSAEKMTYTYNSNTFTNYLGNYWDDYTGSDAEGNGIGDIPYSIGSDEDIYPLVEPFENYEIGPDTTPPTVDSTFPEDGATDVAVGTVITATFSEAMGGSTINASTFTLAGSEVPGTVLYDPDTYTAIFTPNADLDYAHTYTATLSTDIADEAGNPLAEPYTWSFTTTSAPRACWTRINNDSTDYGSVQAAVDAASEGDTVKVAGYCAGVEARAGVTQTVYISKTLTLRGGFTTTNWTTPDPVTNPTTLDAQGQGRVLYITGAIAPTIENLWVTGGDADGLGGDPEEPDAGGGVYIITATTTFSNCWLFGNTADRGGGLYLLHSVATLADTTVSGNITSNGSSVDGYSNSGDGGNGAGLYLLHSEITLTNCTVRDNAAGHGSDAGSYGSYGGNGGDGGGLYLLHSKIMLENSIISGNSTGYGGDVSEPWGGQGGNGGAGGGLYLLDSEIILDNSIISGNATGTGGDVSGLGGIGGNGGAGGGLYLLDSEMTLISSTVSENATGGGGFYNRYSGGAGEGSGGHGGPGGGLYLLHSEVTLDNCIVSGNSTGYGGESGSYLNGGGRGGGGGDGGGIYNAGTLTLNHSTVIGNRTGSGGYGRCYVVGTGGPGGSGGGIYNVETLVLYESTINGNTTGGGGYSGGGSMGSCSAGDGGHGGGIYNEGTLTLVYSTANDNGTGEGGDVAPDKYQSGCGGDGGGIYNAGTLTLDSSAVNDNTAGDGGDYGYSDGDGGDGGGICNAGTLTLDRSTVNGNTTGADGDYGSFDGDDGDGVGGGILIACGSAVTLTNTVVADNQAHGAGSGLYVASSSPRLLHTTIAHNIPTGLAAENSGDGSGVHVTAGSTLTLINTILVSHTVGITVTAGSTAILEATLWGTDSWANTTDWGGAGTIITGTVNVWGDPAFVNPDAGDYHIGPGSAAVDAGIDAGVTTDIDGEARPQGTGYDLGADEYQDGSGPILSIPGNIPAHANQAVTVPVSFTGNGHSIASTIFSVDFDQTCLTFDPTDSDQDGTPDAVTFNLPSAFNASVTFDGGDTDGELDFFIADTFPPLASLPDGTFATITFMATCQPAPGNSIIAPVGFSDDPSASFGNTDGQSVPGTTTDGSVEILPGMPGDCNNDGGVDAGDISALVLEIFDGDGNDPADTPGGTFPGDPVGCNPNGDTIVDAGDISYTVLLIFGGTGTGGDKGALAPTTGLPLPFDLIALSDGPALAIPDQMPASPGSRVTLPVYFTANGHNISSLIFSVDYDQTWLTFDPTDSNGDGTPDAVTFNLPGAFDASVTFDGSDTDGELDFFIADLFPPLSSLPDGAIVSMTLNVGNPLSTTEVAVNFSQDPAASFGNTLGRSIPGTTDNGSVLIGPTDTYGVYLPLLWKSR